MGHGLWEEDRESFHELVLDFLHTKSLVSDFCLLCLLMANLTNFFYGFPQPNL